jgi:small-conductance mechanosensitive channel
MPDRGLAWPLIIGTSGIGGGALIGLLMHTVLRRLAARAKTTSWAWDDLAWGLLRDLALPASVAAGVWWSVHALKLRQPIPDLTDRVLLAGIVLAASLALARLAGSLIGSIAAARSGVAQSASIFVNIARIIVLALGGLMLLQSLGVSITPLLTALGVGGLAVALALQDTLVNLFAGVHILASKKVQPGDFIRLDSGEDGYVVDINWRNTTVRQLAGNLVMIPNARLADAILTNFHRPQQDLSVLVQAGVSYDSDLEQVERVTVEVARQVMREVPGGVPDHEPFIRYHTFADSSINFSVILRAGEYTDQYLVTHEFIKRLHERYRAEAIQIPFPIRTLLMSPPDRASGHPSAAHPPQPPDRRLPEKYEEPTWSR